MIVTVCEHTNRCWCNTGLWINPPHVYSTCHTWPDSPVLVCDHASQHHTELLWAKSRQKGFYWFRQSGNWCLALSDVVVSFKCLQRLNCPCRETLHQVLLHAQNFLLFSFNNQYGCSWPTCLQITNEACSESVYASYSKYCEDMIQECWWNAGVPSSLYYGYGMWLRV